MLLGKECARTLEWLPSAGAIYCRLVRGVLAKSRPLTYSISPVLYHMPARQDAAAAKADLAKREEDLVKLKNKHNIVDDD